MSATETPTDDMEERKEPLEKFWKAELEGPDGKTNWYSKAVDYWNGQEATVDGVLGGFGVTSEPDLKESNEFIEKLAATRKSDPAAFGRSLDVGAGIGRCAKSLLLPRCKSVDLVEPNARLLDTAKEDLKDAKCERFICESMQNFEPEAGRYDLIWIQGVLLYLPDDDLVTCLKRCQKSLADDSGLICLKENVILKGKTWFVDREDNSLTRTDKQFKELFARAGLTLVLEARQQDWPEELLPCMMYAVR